MYRIIRALALGLLLVGGRAAPAAAQAADFCQPGQAPQFNFGFAALKAQVGDPIGDPVECEHANPENGDTLQRTSTGLSFYRKSTNTPTFTNGSEHWGLTADGLLYWTGSTIDPPGTTPPPVAVPPPPAPSLPVPAPAPAPTPPPPLPPTEADIIARVAPSVVQVITESGEGSGVKIREGLLTNAHVVQDATQIQVATSDQRRAPAKILRIDNNGDLALLQTDLAIPPLEMEFMGQQRQGDPVLVLGYPLGLREGGGQATVTRGLVSGTSKEANGQALIQTDAAINHGNSGGAMVNMRGKLIGIPSYGLRVNGAQGVNFAIAMDTVNAFLGLPQSMVMPAPPAALFRGDPRNVALRVSDLTGGDGQWVLDAEDTSELANGIYGQSFTVLPNGDPFVYVVVGVFPSIKLATDQWPSVAKPLDATYMEYPVPSIGEAAYGSVSDQKHTLSISSRVKNVIMTVGVTSSAYLTDVSAVEGSLRQIIDRVNAQAR